jgi:nucleoid DNA-binding protein
MEIIKSTLGSGEDVQIGGRGKFWVKEKREHKGQEPGDRRGHDAGAEMNADF